MTDGTNGPSPLHDLDAAALDALVQAEFDPARVPQELRARATHLAAMFAPIRQDKIQGPSMVDMTMSRLERAMADDATPVELVPDDEEALDAWVTAGYRSGKVASSLRARAERLEAFAHLVTSLPAGSNSMSFARASLVERTMAKIEGTPRARSLDAVPARAGSRWRFADVMSMAAMLLLGGAVLWPIGSSLRSHSGRTDCQANLGSIASALSSYASVFRDSLPMANPLRAGQSWWNVGTPEESNSANLYTLHKAGFSPLSSLACGGNPKALRAPHCETDCDWRSHDEVSYSYRVPTPGATSISQILPTTVVLADRSPVIPLAYRNKLYRPLENSPNHDGRGQTVLLGDGSVHWLTTPVARDGDNLWLTSDMEIVLEVTLHAGQEADRRQRAREMGVPVSQVPVRIPSVEMLIRGVERPKDAGDDFVGP